MNSSTSSSDALRAGKALPGSVAHQALWHRFCVITLVSAVVIVTAFLGLAFVIDPYDTGRSGIFTKAGVRPQGPRTAAASRGRDPAFNAAVFGNSHVQLLSPERLKALSGADFVSMIAPATHPKEQMVLLDWFLRQRKEPPRAIVIGIDGNWCTGNPALPNEKPFPFWLYERSTLAYFKGLLRFDMLEETPRRLTYLWSRNAERARPDGYWDYEPNYIGLGYDVRPDRRAILEERRPTVPVNATARFPAAESLSAALKQVPSATHVILLHPPGYISGLPSPGEAEWETDIACKAAFAQLAAQHPRMAILDWRVDSPLTRDPALWFDHTHYRRAIAEMIERDIGKILSGAP